MVATVATLLNSGGGGAHFGQTTSHPEDLELQLAAGQMVPFLACFLWVFFVSLDRLELETTGG